MLRLTTTTTKTRYSALVLIAILMLILQYFGECSAEENATTNAPTDTSTTPITTAIKRNVLRVFENSSRTDVPASTAAPNIPTSTIKPKGNSENQLPLYKPYCDPKLCEFYNGSHVVTMPHIGCDNDDSFGPTCGVRSHLLYMSERRRNLILDMHNLARSRIAAGQLSGYEPAAHMPQLKWDNELELLATLHVKRCQFAHDQCRNTARYHFSGQNIGYFWIGREFRSHSKRMKWFIIRWFREYHDANQTFIHRYHPHPDGKKIGHFTLLVADRAHRVGCAAIRFRDPNHLDDMKFLMTCNYDYNNVFGEPIYEPGATASKCTYKASEKFPALCDWKDAVYDYDSEESVEDGNTLDNNITL